jgi:hypothetical protein
MEELDTPVSLGVYLQMKYGEWDDVALRKVDPRSYVSAHRYTLDAQAVSFLKKYKALPAPSYTPEKREAACIEQWFASEHTCYRTNLRLRDLRCQGGNQDSRLLDFVQLARKIVRNILGDVPELLEGRFGPGSTYDDRSHLTTAGDKMTSVPTYYPNSDFVLDLFEQTSWRRALAARRVTRSRVIRADRFTTVAKDSTKDRGISIGASLSGFYQLGVGRVMRRKLLSVGIDLDHGQHVHGLYARRASLTGSHATIDLRNASDTVSSELVKLLLPDEWFTLLDWLRAPFTEIPNPKGKGVKVVRLEKFSAMGNGSTFELETLLFYAIAAAVKLTRLGSFDLSKTGLAALDILVYGDDIIVETVDAQAVISALAYFGFEVNVDKTFVSGPFRESCGSDYFEGVSVRAHYLKEELCEPQDWIKLANGLRRFSCQVNGRMDRPGSLLRSWHRCLDALPTVIRKCRGPTDLGDIVVHDDQSRWDTRTRGSIRYIKCYRPARFYRVGWKHFFPDVQLACALLNVTDEQGGTFFSDSPQGDLRLGRPRPEMGLVF